jgi:hypothetical protein
MGLWRTSDHPDRGRHEALGRIQPDARRLGLVARRQQRGAFGGGLQRFRDDDGDGLVGVTNPVALQDIEPEREAIGLLVRSWESAGRLAGVITSTTPGCAFAA